MIEELLLLVQLYFNQEDADPPPEGQNVWEAFWQLKRFSMTIGISDIAAWQLLMGVELEPWEVMMIPALDQRWNELFKEHGNSLPVATDGKSVANMLRGMKSK